VNKNGCELRISPRGLCHKTLPSLCLEDYLYKVRHLENGFCGHKPRVREDIHDVGNWDGISMNKFSIANS